MTIFLVQAEAEKDPLTLAVRPQVATSPAAVRATVRIAPHEGNRRLTLTADSPAFYQSSTISLDGVNAVGGLTRVFDRLPAGTYIIEATLERGDGTKLVETLEVKVLGPKRQL
jgi:hypothetical protein